MTHQQPGVVASSQPLRLWPGVSAVVVQWLALLAVPAVIPNAGMAGLLTALAAGVVVAGWWLFFSRVTWAERLGAAVVMVAGVAVASRQVDPSIATGMMGMMLPIYAIPVLSLALVAWALVAGRLPGGLRRPVLVIAIVVGCAAFTLVRTGGVTGEGASEWHWRWTPTPEEQLLARAADELPPPAQAPVPGGPPRAATAAAAAAGSPEPASAPPPAAPQAVDPAAAVPGARPSTTRSAEWPGFRGPGRDGVVRGVTIETDWLRVPPALMWRRPVGPGWSSFAVAGDSFYTQEQRGSEEAVTCYRVSTGQVVWRHRDAVRFYESNGGAGPRATPTLDRGRVYSLGATGLLNALDAADGSVVWTHDVSADAGVKAPTWGFAASPLVIDDRVVVAAAGRLLAYDRESGERRWTGPAHGDGYSSPHLVELDGVPQVVLLSGAGATSLSPADGAVLWEYSLPGSIIVQPALAGTGDLLVSTAGAAGGEGIRRLSVTRGPGGWTTTERWMSRGLKPYFNDFVVHKGHAYGFDGGILACIDLADGKRIWKGGRYGFGQLVLLPDQDLLLVLSEEGELALVAAVPGEFREVSKFAALSAKTWNHPAIAGDVLFVRNGEEMAAFRLTRLDR